MYALLHQFKGFNSREGKLYSQQSVGITLFQRKVDVEIKQVKHKEHHTSLSVPVIAQPLWFLDQYLHHNVVLFHI